MIYHPAKWQDVQDPHSRHDAQNGRDRLGRAVQRALASEWLSFTPGWADIKLDLIFSLFFIVGFSHTPLYTGWN